VHGDTLIRTANGMVPAKDVQIGDKVLSVNLTEIPTLGNEGDFDYVGFSSESLTSEGLVEVNVIDISPTSKNAVIWFNGDDSKKFSMSQPVFLKTSNGYEIVPTSAVQQGDMLIKVNSDGSITEETVDSIDYDMSEHTVYRFNCEPQDWFIAGDYLVHNK
jgi:hypothetical protein